MIAIWELVEAGEINKAEARLAQHYQAADPLFPMDKTLCKDAPPKTPAPPTQPKSDS